MIVIINIEKLSELKMEKRGYDSIEGKSLATSSKGYRHSSKTSNFSP